jgi:predicted metal-dependent hydrolase
MRIFRKIFRVRVVRRRKSRAHFSAHKEAARQLVVGRVRFFTQHYQFPFGRISIRNQKTRWGSCSKKGNLSFNYKIVTLPPELADYLVVHELCHLKEFNHSPAFWALVAETVPDWRVCRQKLKRVQLF